MNYDLLLAYFNSSISLAERAIVLLSESQQDSTIRPSNVNELTIGFARRIVLISKALEKLLPASKEDYFSFPSVGSLTRVLIESYRPFYCLYVENVTDEEKKFRGLIFFELYPLIEQKSMVKALSNNEDLEIIDELKKMIQKIINDPYYKTLSSIVSQGKGENLLPLYKAIVNSMQKLEKDKEEILSNTFMDKIVKSNGCPKNDQTIFLERLLNYTDCPTSGTEETFNSRFNKERIENKFNKFFNKLMSNCVHSGAFSIEIEIKSDFKTDENVRHWLIQMIACCVFYLVTVICDVIEWCPSPDQNPLREECREIDKGAEVFLRVLTGNSSAEINS